MPECIEKTPCRIREAIPGEEGLIFQMICELAEHEKMRGAVVATERLLREWVFERELARAVFAEVGGAPVGFALYFYNYSTFEGRAGVYLEDLYVRPEARGQGAGFALISHVAGVAVREGCPRMEWRCLDWNAPSIAFYRGLGAVPMDEWTTYRLSGEALKRLGGCSPAY